MSNELTFLRMKLSHAVKAIATIDIVTSVILAGICIWMLFKNGLPSFSAREIDNFDNIHDDDVLEFFQNICLGLFPI